MIDLANIGAPAFVLKRRAGDGCFFYKEFNAAIERVTGLKQGDVLGRSSVEAFGPAPGARLDSFQQRCAETRASVEYETPVRVPLGDCVSDILDPDHRIG